MCCRLIAVWVAILAVCELSPARAQDAQETAEGPVTDSMPSPSMLDTLGSYERSAVLYALEARGLELDEAPEGKVLGRIHVVNLDVFGKAEGFLRVVNFLHITTREHVIEREVLLRPGDPWELQRVEETQRALKDPLFTSLAVVVPVRSGDPNTFDLLTVTRDIWSLRMNSTFEYLQGTITGLRLSVAENNILGLRKHGAFVFDMSQGNFTLGPQYVDKRVLGTRLQLTGLANAIFSRETQEFEGTAGQLNLNYPLWSLRQEWGGGISISQFDSVVRFFRGTELEPFDNPDTPEQEAIDRSYRFRTLGIETSAVRAFGSQIKQQVTMGHALAIRRPEFLDDFTGNDADRVAFARDVFPRSERASSLFINYRLFTPRFVIYRNLSSYDLAEDVRLGPDLRIGTSAAAKLIGSERNFYRANASLSWVIDIAGDGFLRLSGAASTRLQEKELIDNVVTSEVKVAAPAIGNAVRVVAQARIDMLLRERNNGRFLLGGDSGLRGYVISEFAGQRRILTNFELRSRPLHVLFTRIGGVVFWDMGHAADTLGDLRPQHDVGVGARWLVPQLQAVVFRLDWAIPLQGAAAGFPGRISAGVAQVF